MRDQRKIVGDAIPGPWKIWGMTVMADVKGTGLVNDAEDVALTRDYRYPKPRTFNATFIATFDPVLVSALLDVAEAADGIVLTQGAAFRRSMGRLEAALDRLEALRDG